MSPIWNMHQSWVLHRKFWRARRVIYTQGVNMNKFSYLLQKKIIKKIIDQPNVNTKLSALAEAILFIGYIFRPVGRRRAANPTSRTRCQRAATYTCSSANPAARCRVPWRLLFPTRLEAVRSQPVHNGFSSVAWRSITPCIIDRSTGRIPRADTRFVSGHFAWICDSDVPTVSDVPHTNYYPDRRWSAFASPRWISIASRIPTTRSPNSRWPLLRFYVNYLFVSTKYIYLFLRKLLLLGACSDTQVFG